MPKRRAPVIPTNFDFAKNYLELKKLRDEVEFIERSRAGLAGRAANDEPDFDHGNLSRTGQRRL